jgi:glycosyltransferase involved in cell wall biosynthesis
MMIGIDTSRAFGEAKTGTEYYSYQLIKALLGLPESRKHTFVLFTRPKVIIPSEFKRENVIIREIGWKYLWTQIGLAAETWRKFPTRARKESSRPGRANLDVLWVPAHTLPVLRKPGIQTVVTIHGLEYRWLPEYKNWLQRWYLPLSTFYAAKNADRLIAVSEFTKQELQKETHISAKKIKVIHEGVELLHSRSEGRPHSGSVWERYGLEHKKYILFVGTIQPRKNLVALIEAFSHTDLGKLVIAGGIGWMAKEVLRSPHKFGVEERVIFTGRVGESELTTLYQGASVYVQPSLTEGFGLPVLEAMKNRVPVITSDGGALPEVIGEAGIVVKLGDSFVKNLAKAIKMVLAEPKERKRMIAMGQERVKSFTWDKAARETLKLLVG